MGSHRIPSAVNHLDITSFTKPRGQRRKDNKRPMWRRDVDGAILSGSCGFVLPITIAQSKYFY
jgi:hypothetical protein